VVREQSRRVGPVSRGLRMPDGVNDLAVLRSTIARRAGAGPVVLRGAPAQLKAEQISEEVVIAEPGSGWVERYDKRVGVLEIGRIRSQPG